MAKTFNGSRELPIDQGFWQCATMPNARDDRFSPTKWIELTHLDAFRHCSTHATGAPSRRTLANVVPSNVIMQATAYVVRLPTLTDTLDTCAELAAAYVGLHRRDLVTVCVWLRFARLSCVQWFGVRNQR